MSQGPAYRQPGAGGPHNYPPPQYDDDDPPYYPAMEHHPHDPMMAAGPHQRPVHPAHRSLMRQPRIRGSAENLVGKVRPMSVVMSHWLIEDSF